MTEQQQVYVGIGSNVDRENNIRGGLTELENSYGELEVSSVYESRSYGFEGDNFFNLVAGFKTGQPVTAVSDRLKEIEYKYGRERYQEKYAPRTLDIDLLLYGNLICEDEHLVLPREDVLKYSFVLQPLVEIAGLNVHPVNGKTYAVLWQEFTGDRDNLWKTGFDPLSGNAT